MKFSLLIALINAIKHDTDRDYTEFMASVILNFTTSGNK